MADIELVIKIPEEIYKHIMSMQFYIPGARNGKTLLEKILKAIRTGTPLPKGHGELKDADAMINKLCTHEASELFGSVTCAEILEFINDEKPIIEADEGSQNYWAKGFFKGKCPYTGKKCEDWNCNECEVEKAEREWMEE